MKNLFLATAAIVLFPVLSYCQDDTTKTTDPKNKDIIYCEIINTEGKIHEIYGRYS